MSLPYTHLTVPAAVSWPGPLQEMTLGNPWDIARKLSSFTGTNRMVGTDSRSPRIVYEKLRAGHRWLSSRGTPEHLDLSDHFEEIMGKWPLL